MKRLILLAVVLAVGVAAAGWRGRFDEQFAAASTAEWLPAEYQAVEYLESTGTQYLLPDVGTLTTDTSFKIKFIPTYIKPSYNNGIWGTSRDPRFCAFFSLGTESLHTWYGGSALRWNLSINQTVTWTQTGSTVDWTVDGVPRRYTYDGTESLDAYDFRLFSIGGWNANSWIKLFYFSLLDGNTPVCNLVPAVRKSDSVAGMYDLVNGVFYTNQGTGEFIIGPPVVAP
jgi:hypothetical protein